MRRLLGILALAVVLSIAACGDDESEDGESAPAPTAEAEPQPVGEARQTEGKPERRDAGSGKPGTTIRLGGSQFGEVLFDGDGQAIYYFDREDSEQPRCYGECASAWPPVLTEGAPRAADGVSQGRLGTTERDDGSLQVTYDGHPLYLYAHEGPDVVTCHNVAEFGGLWLAVQPSGEPVA